MKYLKKFNTLSAQTQYLTDNEVDTYVGYVEENDTVYYDNAIIINYAKKYLTIEALENGDLTFTNSTNTLYYSLDKTTWNPITSTDTISFNAGQKIMLKGTNMTVTTSDGIGRIHFSGNHNVYGNILTLISGDEFPQEFLYSESQFRSLFAEDTKLISAENLILLATTLTNGCYATMFAGCTSLTKAPKLPATTLANNCYSIMFNGCTSLETAPELLATTLATSCYASMFCNCSNLNYVKMMAFPVDSANTSNWLSNVASSGTLITYCDTELPSGGSGLPNGWTQVKQEYDGSECSSGNEWAE